MSGKKNTSIPTSHNFHFLQDLLGQVTMVPDLLLENYQQLDLTEEQLVRLLQLQAHTKNMTIFTSACLRNQFADVDELLALFCEKGLVVPEPAFGEDHYSWEGLFQQLWEIWCYTKSCSKKRARKEQVHSSSGNKEFAALCKMFEQELARCLSPIEAEKVDKWLTADGFTEPLIEEALRRAVLQGKATLNYIDRILLNWKKQNLRTLSEVMKNDEYGASKKQTARSSVKKKAPAVSSEYDAAYDKFLKS